MGSSVLILNLKSEKTRLGIVSAGCMCQESGSVKGRFLSVMYLRVRSEKAEGIQGLFERN